MLGEPYKSRLVVLMRCNIIEWEPEDFRKGRANCINIVLVVDIMDIGLSLARSRIESRRVLTITSHNLSYTNEAYAELIAF